MAQQMRVAAVDYGLNCGLAIARLSSSSNHTLIKESLQTIYNNNQGVIDLIEKEDCLSVVLERKPSRSSGVGASYFDEIYTGLQKLGFITKNKLFDPEKSLVLISPGMWKPFVGKQLHLAYLTHQWDPKTIHEKDAMSMLWYAVRIWSNDMEILYG